MKYTIFSAWGAETKLPFKIARRVATKKFLIQHSGTSGVKRWVSDGKKGEVYTLLPSSQNLRLSTNQ